MPRGNLGFHRSEPDVAIPQEEVERLKAKPRAGLQQRIEPDCFRADLLDGVGTETPTRRMRADRLRSSSSSISRQTVHENSSRTTSASGPRAAAQRPAEWSPQKRRPATETDLEHVCH